MADSAGGQLGHQGHTCEDSPLTRRRAREGMAREPEAPGQGTAFGAIVAPGKHLVLCHVTSKLGGAGCGLAHVDCPADVP